MKRMPVDLIARWVVDCNLCCFATLGHRDVSCAQLGFTKYRAICRRLGETAANVNSSSEDKAVVLEAPHVEHQGH